MDRTQSWREGWYLCDDGRGSRSRSRSWACVNPRMPFCCSTPRCHTRHASSRKTEWRRSEESSFARVAFSIIIWAAIISSLKQSTDLKQKALNIRFRRLIAAWKVIRGLCLQFRSLQIQRYSSTRSLCFDANFCSSSEGLLGQ